MPKLVLFRKTEIIREYILSRKNTFSIGSARLNDIVVNEKNVSEHHATVTKTAGDKYSIKDNNTITGTKVNDRTVVDKELQFGDIITIAGAALQFLPDRRMGKREGEDEAHVLPRYSLLGVYGQYYGKRFDLPNGDTNIGRENISPKGIENGIVLGEDNTVSKGHAKITCQNGKNFARDVGSTGGLAVNGEKVGQFNSVPINPGDEIAIGRTIFRFVESNNLDYSSPVKHHIFFLKIRQPLIIASTIILLFAGFFAMIYGAKTGFFLTTKPAKLQFDMSRTWSASGNTLRAVPADYDAGGALAIADLNNDGVNDIIFLSATGFLYAWDGKEGAQLWAPVAIPNPGKCSPAVADMNGDGIPDIVVTGNGANLYIIDGQSGGIIYKEILGGSIAEMSPCVCDLNGDGKQDVVVCSEEGTVYFLYAPGYAGKMEKFTQFVDPPVYASPVIVTTEKISPLVVVCSYNSKVFFIDGKTRTKKTVDLVEKTGKAHLMSVPPAIGDLNGDRIPEVVVESNVPQYISSIEIMDFNVNWTYFVEPIPPSGIKHHSAPLITDLNGDGLGDVLVTSTNGNLYALKGKTGYPTGELLWKMEVPGMKRTVATPALYDFDKNGLKEFVVGTEDGTLLFVKNSPKRKGMEIMSSLKVSNEAITSPVVIGDINGDGLVEVVDVNTINAVQVVTTNVRTIRNALLWPVYLGNNLRTGVASASEDATFYVWLAVSGFLIICGIIVVYFIVSRKKAALRPRMIYL